MAQFQSGFNLLMYWLCSFDKALYDKVYSGDLDQSEWAITVTDADANLLYVNESFCRLVGCKRQKLLSMNVFEILSQDTFERLNNYSEYFMRCQSKFRCDILSIDYRHQNRSWCTVEEIVRVITYDDKHFIFSLIYLPDQKNKKDNALTNYLNKLEAEFLRLNDENVSLKKTLSLRNNYGNMVVKSRKFKQVLKAAEKVAETDTTVLILGETGTGKELLASFIHGLSPRSENPLIKVNCAALPPGLIESELFGHAKGAFTGAHQKQKGRFEMADKGTIFLDEIGDLPMQFQTRLLRVLQEREINRVGEGKTIKVDVRVIAATNRNLAQEVESGNFREDLYYRLNVFPLTNPPLRERKEDIPSLIHYFLDHYNRKFGKHIEIIPKATLTKLYSHRWPGNIRELENVLERSVILTSGRVLENDGLIDLGKRPQTMNRFLTLKEIEKEHILKILDKTGWRVSGEKGAAKILDIHPKTLESRLKKLGIRRPSISTSV